MLNDKQFLSAFFIFSSFLFVFVASIDCPKLHEFNKIFSAELNKNNISNFLSETNQIGAGVMGSVFKVPWLQQNDQKKTKIFVAVKKAKSVKDREDLENEIAVLREFNLKDLKHVAKYFGCFLVDGEPFLVMEHLPHSLQTETEQIPTDNDFLDYVFAAIRGVEPDSLPDFYKRFVDFPPEKRLEIYLQIAEGLAEMHALGYVHHDLKPDNIALGPEPELFVRLIDFGLTQLNSEGNNGGCSLYFDREKLEYFDVGASEAAIEKLEKNNDHWKADIWALGMSIFELESIRNFPKNQFLVQQQKNYKKFTKLVRKKVMDKKWFKTRKMNICSENKMVCFYDVMNEIMKEKRKDRTIKAREIAKAFAQILGRLPEPQKKFGASKGFFSTIGKLFVCNSSKKEKGLLII